MVTTDARRTAVNINDALHACSPEVQNDFIQLLRRLYPRLDYVFCGYGTASHFPNCYRVPAKDYAASAVLRQRHFNRSWARVMHELAPRFGFPFAADVVHLEEDLWWANEPVHNTERPTDTFRQAYPSDPTTVLDIAPGFAIDDDIIVSDRRRVAVSANDIASHYGEAIRRVNRYARIDPADFGHMVKVFGQHVDQCRPYLASSPLDYRMLIRFRGNDEAISIVKRRRKIDVAAVAQATDSLDSYDLIYTTRLSYLRNSLTTPWGHEVLFVGSGGIFDYRRAERLHEGLHGELLVMLRPAEMCPPRRPRESTLPPGLKRFLKRFISRGGSSLYHLPTWTIFSAARQEGTRKVS